VNTKLAVSVMLPVSEMFKKRPVDGPEVIVLPLGLVIFCVTSYRRMDTFTVDVIVAPLNRLKSVPKGRTRLGLPVKSKPRVPRISNVNSYKKVKPCDPVETSSKVAPSATVMKLNRILKNPPRDVVSRLMPGGMYRSQPPTNAQKSIVGAIPPSHVGPSVKSPDSRGIHMTESNVSVVPSINTLIVNDPVKLPPMIVLPVSTPGGVAPVKLMKTVLVPMNCAPGNQVNKLSPRT